MKRALPFTLAVLAVTAGSAQARVPRDSDALPATYVGRGVVCPAFTSRSWTSWITYATATEGDRWDATASAASLCDDAARAGNSIIREIRGAAGTGHNRLRLEFWAKLFGARKRVEKAEKADGAPNGWVCRMLPSLWGVHAYAALAAHPGGALAEAFATASGPAAGAGFCGRTRRGKRQFIAWLPRLRACDSLYKLQHNVDDPDHPDSPKTKPYGEASYWSDYDRSDCGP